MSRPSTPPDTEPAGTGPPAAAAAPPVSVVVPTRGRPELLRETLDAVLAQDYAGPLEVLVVHDQCEPDRSLALSRPGRSVRALANTRTPGLAGARNTGILAAGGDLVAFCDDDDVWLPAKLTRQVALLAAEPGVELACCGIRVLWQGETTERVLDHDSVSLAELLGSRRTELHPSTFLIRRGALLDGLGLVDEALPGSYAEDYELLLRAARRGPVRTVPEALVEVRWHQSSYFAGRWETISEALGHLLERYPEFETVPHGAARVHGQIAFAEAARGRRGASVRACLRTLRRNPGEARAYLALAVDCRLTTAPAVMRRLHARGRGL